MRIGIFTNNYLPSVSGVTISVDNFRKELTRLGHQALIFAPNYKETKLERKISDRKQNVFRFPSVGLGKDTSYYSLAIPFTPKIDHIIKNSGLDVIHSQHPYWVGQTALWYSKRLKLPLVFTYHTLYEEYSHYVPLLPQTLIKWYLKKSSLEYVFKSDMIIAPSQSVKKMIEERVSKYLSSIEVNVKNFSKKLSIRVLPSGIDVKRFQNGDGGIVRKKYGVGDNDILLLSVCRLAEEKNLDFLVRSLTPILRNSSVQKKIFLMLVGQGPYGTSLVKLVDELKMGDKVKFTGFVPNNEIIDYYKAGNIFVYTSVTETQGLILAEALASGLPVVAVDASGSRDTIINNKNGFLTKNDEAEFREKVKYLIDNLELRKKFSQAAIETANDYSIENCAKKLVMIYEEAIEKKKSLARV